MTRTKRQWTGEEVRALTEKLLREKADAWDEGASAGWDAGVSDANDDEPVGLPSNPYR